MKKKILIVDDEKLVRENLRMMLCRDGYLVDMAESAEAALALVKQNNYQVIIMDYILPEMDGIEAMKKIKNADTNVHIIMITGHGDIDIAVKALKAGAEDFVTKPVNSALIKQMLADIFTKIEQAQQLTIMQMEKGKEPALIIGSSPVIKRLTQLLQIIARAETDAILITGENGTGKELAARTIHQQSPRLNKPFVDINCTAIPEELFESQLFGYEKGAFTGANESRKGFFELADSGIIFLDEIGELSQAMQVKLLRVLEERSFYRVGGQKKIEFDAMVICATNRDIKQMDQQGTFRRDLYYRINLMEVAMPSLRDIKADIPELVRYFVAQLTHKYKKSITNIADNVMTTLEQYNYPGNVRELRNIVERAIILSQGTSLDQLGLSPVHVVEREQQTSNSEQTSFNLAKKEVIENFEKKYVENLLLYTNGNVVQAAKLAGMKTPNLSRLLKKNRINKKTFRN